jgi:hypothetical protein
MSRKTLLLVGSALAALAAVGCGLGDNGLSGSLSEVFPLDVSSVAVLRNDQALVVQYQANDNNDIDLVLRFTLALDGLPDLKGGMQVNLVGLTDGGVERASFVHNAAGEPARVLPAVSIGQFNLDRGGNPGDVTSGAFSASFVADGSYGSGRAVTGTFHAVALDGGYGDWIP